MKVSHYLKLRPLKANSISEREAKTKVYKRDLVFVCI